MKKLFSKNIFAVLSSAFLAVGIFLAGTLQVSAEITGRELSANLGAADLSEIASKWPYLLLIGLVVVVLLVVVEFSYRPKEKDNK